MSRKRPRRRWLTLVALACEIGALAYMSVVFYFITQ